MRIHFISIGGSVMHQIALALSEKGYAVTGSDDEIFEPARSNLAAAGLLPPQIGWYPDKITKDIDAVILGMHARADNEELIAAQNAGIPVYSFPEYVYRESEDKLRVAVGGSHGKTTTTAMIMHVLRFASQDFDYLVGARLEGFERSVKLTDAPVIVCEADEYPASAVNRRPKFHFLFPRIAVITGIAWDHINIFTTFENYVEQFALFIEKIEEGGSLIYNETDDTLLKLVKNCGRSDLNFIPYQLPEYRIDEGITEVKIGGEKSILHVFGNHNLLNLQAALYVCRLLGVDDKTFATGIASFSGAARRLELLWQDEQSGVYRDFAHAPSKVKASIQAMKEQFPQRKLVAVLELHTYSSLDANFMNEYRGAMELADEAIVFYSSHALQLKRMKPLQPSVVMEGFNKPGLNVVNSRADLEKLLSNPRNGSVNYLFMSSGSYDGMDILKTLSI